jgi:hypothetical protein
MSCPKNIFTFLLFVAAFLVSCHSGTIKKNNNDTPISGKIYISVDESFRPVREQEIEM